jgi:peptidyl-prolyl cis-trans isomerase B (cyclophilin B)
VPTNEQRRANAKRKLERQMVYRQARAKKRRIIAVVSTVVVVALVGGGVWFLATHDFSKTDAAASETETPKVDIPTEIKPLPKRPTPLAEKVACEYRKDESSPPAKQVNAPNGTDVSSVGTVNVNLKTNQGDVPITLDRSLAPCAANSFASLVEQGYFNGTPCHRLSTKGLQMLQCGDPTGTGSGGPGYKFDNEVWPELTYGRGYLAMANAGPDKDDPKKGTNGSQFFIVYGNAQLSPDYTVFGSIGEPGLKVVDDIARAGDDGSMDPSPGGGKPNKEVKIETATIAK